MKARNLIVGCGISGATLARKLADSGERVTVIDARSHIGGNCYDCRDSGIMVHRYGTHIFHTADRDAWNFCSRFTKWYPYQHKVLGLVDGRYVPIPFNLNSLRMLFPKSMADAMERRLLAEFGLNAKVPILELRKTGDADLEFLADYVYRKVFLEYTLKQWGLTPDAVDPGVTGRVPVYVGRDDRYFQDTYQGIPLDGFTAMFRNMLDHPNITLRLETPFSKTMRFDRLFYTGAIDEFFDYELGELPYRSVRLDFLQFAKPRFQDAAVVNYPSNYEWTRIAEYKWLLDERSENTIVSYEYPEAFCRGRNERAYPVVGGANAKLYGKYRALAGKRADIRFLGRLGEYQYYDMDKAVARALDVFREISA